MLYSWQKIVNSWKFAEENVAGKLLANHNVGTTFFSGEKNRISRNEGTVLLTSEKRFSPNKTFQFAEYEFYLLH